MPTFDERSQPAKDAVLVDTKSRRHVADGLPLTHRLDGLLAHDLQRVVVVSSTTGYALACLR